MSFSKSGWFTVALTCFLLAWLGGTTDKWWQSYQFKGQQPDYYNLLVDGFLDGQLSMKAEVHPDRLNPDINIRRHAPYMLDAALYEGKYYLYYGVVPAALILLPYSWLTGHDITINVAVLFLCVTGYLFSMALYAAAKQRYFAKAAPIIDVVTALVLGFGSMLPLLVRRSAFYELPIAAGYTCIIIAIFCLYRAYHHRNRAILWIGFASLFAGLSVGCRPSYIFALPTIAFAACWIYRQTSGDKASILRKLTVAAVLPAAVVGILLGLHNYARFGAPWDFGFKYGLNAFFDTGKPLTDASFVLPNLTWYYFTPPALSWYFPFLQPINAAHLPPLYYSDEAIHGQFLIFCLAVVTLIGLVGVWRFKRPSFSPLSSFLLSVIWIGSINLVFLLIVGVRADRYMVDFQAPFMIVITFAGAICSVRLGHNTIRRLWVVVFSFFGIAASTANIFNAVELFDGFAHTRPETFRKLSYYGNYPSHFAEKLGLIHYGPIRFNVEFPEKIGEVQAPLLVTGTPGKTDVVYAHQASQSSVIFHLLHSGYGGPNSKIYPFDPQKPQTVEIDLGSLYPPAAHPYFDGWNEADIKRLKTMARIVFNGETVIQTFIKTYDAPPNWINFGRNPAGIDAPFRGKISAISRLKPRSADELTALSQPGWFRAKISFPSSLVRRGQPLLGSGVSGAGNLLFSEVLDKNKIRIGLDQWGGGATNSPPITIATDTEHVLEIFVGPQVLKKGIPQEWEIPAESLRDVSEMIHVWLNGQLVWSVRTFTNLDSYDVANLGQNLQGFSSSGRDFGGYIEEQPFQPDEQREFVLRNVAPAAPQTEFEIIELNPITEGVVRAEVQFTSAQSGIGQPIFASGVEGAGNMLYVEISGENQIQFGFDEWGVGARFSEKLDLDFSKSHKLELFVGPLAATHNFPEEWGISPSQVKDKEATFTVWLDDQLVWSFIVHAHQASYAQAAYLGRNPQKFSTATSRFGASIKQLPMSDEERKSFVLKNLSANRGPN
jgi:hypothetical protein